MTARRAEARGAGLLRRAIDRYGPDGSLALLCGCAALAVSLFRLDSPSLWMDEAFSVALARQPFSVLAAAFWSGSEPNMLLYHILLHVWLQVTGWLGIPASEFVVRLPSAIFATLSAPVVFLLGRRLLGRVAGCAAALLFLLNPLELTYAQQTRSYALQVLLVCVAWYALIRALSQPPQPSRQTRWWALYTCVSVLAVYAQAFSLLILLSQAIAFALLVVLPTPWRDGARSSVRAMGVSLGGAFLLIAPLLYASRSGSKTGWLPAPNLANLISHYGGQVLSRGGLLALVGLIVIAVLGALAWIFARIFTQQPLAKRLIERLPKLNGAFRTVMERPEPLPPVLITLLSWFFVPVVVSFVISQGPLRLFSTRYLVVVAPAVCLLLGVMISLIRWRAGQLVAASGLVCVTLLFVPSYYARAQVEDWRGPTRWLEHAYQPGDGLVCYNNVQGCQLAVEYYLVTDHSQASFTPDSPGVTQLALYGHGDPFVDYTAALDPQALSAFGGAHSRIFIIAGRLSDAQDAAHARAVQTWLDCRYHYVAQAASAVVTIRLYTTTAAQTACPLPSTAGAELTTRQAA